MAYQKKFTKPFPGGYRDFPDESTIITASVMDNYDQTLEDFDTEFETVDGKLEKLKGVDNLKSAFKFDESGNPVGVEVVGDVVANGVSLIETKEAVSANEANITKINSSLTSVENRVTSVEKKATDNADEIVRVDGRVDELKGDLDEIKENVILQKNLVIDYISGYFVGDRDNKVTFYENESYGYVIIPVEGGKTYTLSVYGSDSFSRIASEDGTNLGKPNLYKDTTKSGYVYTMPENAKYFYICSSGWTSKVDIVAFEGNEDITGTKHISEYPYNEVTKVLIDKLYISSKRRFLNEILADDINVNYDNISDCKMTEIRDDVSWIPLSAGSSQVVDNNDGTYTFKRIASSGGGITSHRFGSNSDSTTILLKGTSSNGHLAITLRIIDENDITIKSIELFNENVGTDVFEKKLSFDSAYYAVYENAKQFAIFITSNGAQGDTITFSCVVYEPSQIQKISIYDSDFTKMMVNIDNALNNEIQKGDVLEYIVSSPNGNKFVIGVDNNGTIISIPTIPNKTLFVGNSLLLGLGTDRGGLFGMCASNPQSDYAYLVEQAIIEKCPDAVFSKIHGAGYEQSTSESEFNSWWNGYNIQTNEPTKNSFTSDLNLIIIQLGDNINTNERIENLKNTSDLFLTQIKTLSPKARILWVDGWFNSEKNHDIIAEICNKWKIQNIYIKDLNKTENQGYSGQVITCYDGSSFTVPDSYITHPGDIGMSKIAERIIDAMQM